MSFLNHVRQELWSKELLADVMFDVDYVNSLTCIDRRNDLAYAVDRKSNWPWIVEQFWAERRGYA